MIKLKGLVKEISDEKNPKYLFNTIDTTLLVAIINKKIDPVKLAAKQLADRGLNKKGFWIGFDKAYKIHGIKEAVSTETPKQLKGFPKSMPKAQVNLAKGTAEKALAFKKSKPGNKDYFSASTPVKKYAMKYSEKELENQIKYLGQMMKKF